MSKNSAYDSKESAAGTSGKKSGEFFNAGLERWINIRKEWRKRIPEKAKKQPSPSEMDFRDIDVDEIVDRISGRSGTTTFREPLPLANLIDILVDLWESEEGYD